MTTEDKSLLTDEQAYGLMEKAATDPAAPSLGFNPKGEDGWYWFSKRASGVFLGHYDTGDGVIPSGVRAAVQSVVRDRGNFGESRMVATAFWDIVRNPVEQWTSSTALVLCCFAPLLQAAEMTAEDMGL